MQEHTIREKYVVNKLTDIINEFKSLFVQIEGKDAVPLRMQLVGAFTIVDVLGNYWFEYLGRKDGTQKLRFYEFVEEFCITNLNDIYRKTSLMSGVSKEKFYDFRNSLVHFYGIGKVQNYAIFANFSKKYTPKIIIKMVTEFRKKIPDLVIIQPQEIRDLVVNGSILMLEKMIAEIHKSQTDQIAKQNHILGISRIYNKLLEEGAEGVK